MSPLTADKRWRTESNRHLVGNNHVSYQSWTTPAENGTRERPPSDADRIFVPSRSLLPVMPVPVGLVGYPARRVLRRYYRGSTGGTMPPTPFVYEVGDLGQWSTAASRSGLGGSQTRGLSPAKGMFYRTELRAHEWQGLDLNQRPRGYEPRVLVQTRPPCLEYRGQDLNLRWRGLQPRACAQTQLPRYAIDDQLVVERAARESNPAKAG